MDANPKITRRKLADYKPAPDNPNQHNERGLQIIEDSINYNGAGRSGLAAADGTLLAGNGTWEAMQRAGIEEVVEIEIDGKQWVVVKRQDLAPTDPRAKALMVADNRASQIDYTPDNELLAAILGDIAAHDEQLVKAAGYSESDLRDLLDGLAMATIDDWAASFDKLPDSDRAPFQQMTFTLHDSQVEIVSNALRMAKQSDFSDSPNENSNGNALAAICEAFCNGQG